MMVDIVLINPRGKFELAEELNFISPPLGLAYLASVLRREGYKVKIIDAMAERLDIGEVIRRLKDCFLVGITATTPLFKRSIEYAREIKRIFPEKFVLLGGVHVTYKPLEGLRVCDAVCIGEGEETIVEVARRVEEEKSLEGVKGIYWKKEDKIIKNRCREPIYDLDSIPFPAFDLLPLDRYSFMERKLEEFPMITSRGCPFSCLYCVSSKFFGRKYRCRSPENVVEEMKWLEEDFKARHVAFSDDTFTLIKRRVERICEELRKERVEVTWSCASRADTIDRELARVMRRAGCTKIYFGVESASEEVLRFYRKKLDLKTVEKAIRICKEEGIETVCSFIIGSPYESEEEMMRTLKLAIKLDPDYAQFSILTPYPGTELYEIAEKENLLITKNYEDYTAGKPVMRNIYLSPERIKDLLNFCYTKFYARPKYLIKMISSKNFRLAYSILKRLLLPKNVFSQSIAEKIGAVIVIIFQILYALS